MNKENILFGIVGLLGGLIIGFMFANSYNRNMATPTTSVNSSSMVSQNPNMPEGHPDVGSQTQPKKVDYQPAVDNAKKNPTDFEAQIKAADLLYQAEIYDQALEFLGIANKLKPDDYETIVNLGNTNFDAGKYQEAEKWYLNALSKNKEDVNVRTDLGLTFIFRETPNYDRAIQEFNSVLSANPNHIQALQNSIVAYIKKGDSAKAKENLAKLESIQPTNSFISRLKEQINKIGS